MIYMKIEKIATNISISVYQNVNENLTIWLSKCQRTSHYQTIKLSTNISLSGYQNAVFVTTKLYPNN
jgi:hypothetical protein